MNTQIMAIVNVSPDSFSGDGIASVDALKKRIAQVVSEGADILDIGGQSTRPGAEIITTDEEIRRVVPAITAARQLTNLPISVDTFKPAVARAALEAGATIINDVHGFADREMIQVAQSSQADLVVMHSRGTPQTMNQLTDYKSGLFTELSSFFAERTQQLIDAGIAPERIIIDPGIGFAKTMAQSFEATRHLAKLRTLGFRVLYGASMKSFLGKALGTETDPAPVEERAVATTVTSTWALLQQVAIIRVHDVKAAVQARRIVSHIVNETD